MIREAFKISVQEFAELERNLGFNSAAYIDKERVVLYDANIEELIYFYNNCRGKNKCALFHDNIFMYFYFEKMPQVDDELFNQATLAQKKLIFKYAAKSTNAEYISKMFYLCPVEFKKEQLMLARAVVKHGCINSALVKKDLHEPIRDYLFKAAIKQLNTGELVGYFCWCAHQDKYTITKEHRDKLLSVLCKRKDIPYYIGCMFSKVKLKEFEVDRLVYALGKFGACDIIASVSRYNSNKLSYKNIEFLQFCYNKKMEKEHHCSKYN